MQMKETYQAASAEGYGPFVTLEVSASVKL
jgi:hypothetical protein